MNTCDPCQQCEPVPCVQTPPPEVIIPCVAGESCAEITNAKCVQYSGANLTNISVLTNDRLDVILNKININHQAAGLVIGNTPSTALSGAGTTGSPLLANINLDPIPDNLLIETSTGLKVEFTKANILGLFQMIENDTDLQAAFCTLVANCTNSTCGIPTGITATIT